MDTVSPEVRSRVMAAVRSRDTTPELLVRHALRKAGWRYRICDKRLPGHPDIVVPRCRALIEIRGCFWHRHGWVANGRRLAHEAFCPNARTPKSNLAFWNAKFRRNVQRDAEHERLWAELGWNVLIVWECGLKTGAEREKTFRFILRNLERWAKGCP